jgi:CxxC motif-containing protein
LKAPGFTALEPTKRKPGFNVCFFKRVNLYSSTKVRVRVEMGDVVIKDIKNSTVNTINVENWKGDIEVGGGAR